MIREKSHISGYQTLHPLNKLFQMKIKWNIKLSNYESMLCKKNSTLLFKIEYEQLNSV